MGKMLDNNVQKQVKEFFIMLKNPVAILFFGNDPENCDYCEPTLDLLKEIVALNELLSLHEFDISKNADLAKKYHVDKTPGIVLAGKEGEEFVDYGIRFSGMPSGHEFSTLIHDMVLVSRRETNLSPATISFLRSLEKPVYLQVFVTPICPHCPRAVVLAHQLAFEGSLVEAEMVEASEFPELAEQYGVSGVPHTLINFGAGELIGAAPEMMLVEQIKLALANEK